MQRPQAPGSIELDAQTTLSRIYRVSLFYILSQSLIYPSAMRCLCRAWNRRRRLLPCASCCYSRPSLISLRRRREPESRELHGLLPPPERPRILVVHEATAAHDLALLRCAIQIKMKAGVVVDPISTSSSVIVGHQEQPRGTRKKLSTSRTSPQQAICTVHDSIYASRRGRLHHEQRQQGDTEARRGCRSCSDLLSEKHVPR
jgi:hypothetical protein